MMSDCIRTFTQKTFVPFKIIFNLVQIIQEDDYKIVWDLLLVCSEEASSVGSISLKFQKTLGGCQFISSSSHDDQLCLYMISD